MSKDYVEFSNKWYEIAPELINYNTFIKNNKKLKNKEEKKEIINDEEENINYLEDNIVNIPNNYNKNIEGKENDNNDDFNIFFKNETKESIIELINKLKIPLINCNESLFYIFLIR